MGLIIYPHIIRLAKKLKLLSPVDYRRKNQTPLLGGAVIYFIMLFFSIILDWGEVRNLLMFSFPLVVIALLDDVIEVNSKLRALVQVACVSGWLYVTPQSELILSQLMLPGFIIYPLIVFWVVGIINAINMIDGMDLEAGIFSTICCLALAIMFRGQVESYFLFALAGALCSFMFYNKPPAKIYLGDCGSMFLGFTLALISLKLPLVKGPSLAYVLVPLMLFAFPEVDAVLAIFRRLKNSGSVMAPDKDHLHHRLQKVGFSVKGSASILACIILYSAVTALANFYFIGKVQLLTVNFLAISGLVMILTSLYFMERGMVSQVSNMSQSLINKYLAKNNEVNFTEKNYYAVVYDLLPYYKEIQLRGVSEVNNFVKNFSEFIQENHEQSYYHTYGSYTVIALSKGSYSANLGKKELVESYYNFIKEHKVMKSESPIPWGMSFHSHKSKGESILEKFGISTENQDIIKAA